MTADAPAFRRRLLAWYDEVRRELPWRRSTDFYPVWISEIMLQQTRVEAAIPHYVRFLGLFPDVRRLAEAPEQSVLAAWSGLGYYSRARNIHKAARMVAAAGTPVDRAGLLALPGAGPYTAAAIGSIALGLPHAAVDGNVIRVVSRLTDDDGDISLAGVRRRFGEAAQWLLDPGRPGDFNQAMMELGATVCVPARPDCERCPVEEFCLGRRAGRERALPVQRKKAPAREVGLDLALFERESRVFLVRRDASEKRMADFWELPERSRFLGLRGRRAGEFTHQIVNDRFRVRVFRMPGAGGEPLDRAPEGRWFGADEFGALPLTTIARKALAISR